MTQHRPPADDAARQPIAPGRSEHPPRQHPHQPEQSPGRTGAEGYSYPGHAPSPGHHSRPEHGPAHLAPATGAPSTAAGLSGTTSSASHPTSAIPRTMGSAPGTAAGAAPAPGLVAEGVSRSFGQVRAVQDLSFTAPRGQVTALVGPNGCGKSTLMLMLASLLAPDAGRVLVGGIDPAQDSPAVRSLVGWMPDQFGAWDSLRVAEVLEVMGRAYFMPWEQLRPRVQELLQLMDLVSLAQQPAHVLSRGQKQRLGLARALVHRPQVLILDEPASGLDPASRRRLLTVVRSLAADGVTVLVSSHILSELEEMADHVVLMDSGRVVDASSVRDLARRPQQWRVESLDDHALGQALDALQVRHRGVRSARMSPSGHAEVLVQLPDEATAARLLAALAAQDAQVVGFGPATGRLEAAYLASGAAQREGAL